jgi:hypothetical protein
MFLHMETFVVSNTSLTDGSLRPQVSVSNNLLIGYVVAVSMVALLWAGVHGQVALRQMQKQRRNPN